MTIQTTQHIPQPHVHDEQILVVKRSLLLGNQTLHGFKEDSLDSMLTLIQKHQEFLPRSQMELDPTYKQIIPYLIFRHADQYFLMQRRADSSEQRLKNKCTLGIGGHIRQEDMTQSSIISWAEREFDEEITYHGDIIWRPLGIVNDDTNAVGQVHIGLVFLAEGSSDQITVKSELKSGTLVSLDTCKEQYDRLETWSQFIVDFLAQEQQP